MEGAIEKLGASRAHPVSELAAQLVELLDGAEEVHYLPGDEPPGAATDPRPDPRTHPEFWCE